MRFVPLDIERHWNWVSFYAQCKPCQDTKGIVCEDSDGGILAAAIFDSWSYNSCQIHIAIDNPFVIKHGFLREISEYVFRTANRGVLLGFTPADNAKARRFNEHAGMREIFRIKDGFKLGIDYIVTQMRKEECQWLEEADGRQRLA